MGYNRSGQRRKEKQRRTKKMLRRLMLKAANADAMPKAAGTKA